MAHVKTVPLFSLQFSFEIFAIAGKGGDKAVEQFNLQFSFEIFFKLNPKTLTAVTIAAFNSLLRSSLLLPSDVYHYVQDGIPSILF